MELLIVLVIVSVLSCVAYPSYHRHLRRVDRQMAQAGLIALGQAMERARLQHSQGVYPNPHPGYPAPPERDGRGQTVRLESIYPLEVPQHEREKRWKMGLSARSASYFRLYANPLRHSKELGCLIYESTGRRCHFAQRSDCSSLDCAQRGANDWD